MAVLSGSEEGDSVGHWHETGWWQKAKEAADKINFPSPQFFPAGGGLFMTLSNWGLLPQV